MLVLRNVWMVVDVVDVVVGSCGASHELFNLMHLLWSIPCEHLRSVSRYQHIIFDAHANAPIPVIMAHISYHYNYYY